MHPYFMSLNSCLRLLLFSRLRIPSSAELLVPAYTAISIGYLAIVMPVFITCGRVTADHTAPAVEVSVSELGGDEEASIHQYDSNSVGIEMVVRLVAPFVLAFACGALLNFQRFLSISIF
eukprot:GEMP01120034.1.p1 GENE.GEMP01120034.1~~GEMP01120034.1.p1  ORF type:complete len:120 (+),score=14.54 GEMP01120034.1:226-585(+)